MSPKRFSHLEKWGSCNGTVVEYMPFYREVTGSNPAKCWAFFVSFYPYSNVSLKQVPDGGAALLIFSIRKNE